MWSIFKALLAQGVIASTVLRAFSWLAWILPIGAILKFVGWPLLMVLGVLALPVFVLLLFLGLPIFVVIIVGGLLISLAGVVLTAGFALLKIAIPIAIGIWVVRWMFREKAAPTAPAPAAEGPAAT